MATNSLVKLREEIVDLEDKIESLEYDVEFQETLAKDAQADATEAQIEVRVLRSVLELAAGSSAVKVVAATEE